MKGYSAAIVQAHEQGKPSINLIELYFSQGAYYLTDAPFDYSWDGKTYLGNGVLLDIDDVMTKTQLTNISKRMEFSGVDVFIKAAVLSQSQINREVKQYRVFFESDDVNGFTPIGEPFLEWQGTMGSMNITDNRKNSKISLETNSIFDDFDRRVNRNTTLASQQRHFPLDTGMRFASETNKQVPWGIK